MNPSFPHLYPDLHASCLACNKPADLTYMATPYAYLLCPELPYDKSESM